MDESSADPLVEELRRNWDEFGRRNPVWAINSGLPTDDWGEFFASGEAVVAHIFEQLTPFGVAPGPGAALDFGCGAGRLTQALARRFDRAVGVDVAATMIELAERFNQYPERCDYLQSVSPDLGFLAEGSFEFSLSVLVLQHMEPDLAAGYIAELVRVLRPGGAAAFQVPARLRDSAPLEPPPLGGSSPYRASLRRASSRERLVVDTEADRPLTVQVLVTNESTTTWAPEHQVRLGKRWLSARDRAVVEPEDDGTRALLPGTVAPSMDVVVSMQLAVPAEPGEYLLELDLLQEGVTWFRQHGSPTLILPVTVTGEARTKSPGLPRMEMHGLPREQVAEAVARSGGQLLAALDDHSAGPEWESFLYVARRAAS